MNRLTTHFVAACAGALGFTAAFANDGHGLADMHWHATDAWGFVAVTVMIAVAIWLSRK